MSARSFRSSRRSCRSRSPSSCPRSSEIRQKVKKLGLWAPHIPSDLGGLGLNCVEYALVGEELGRSPLGHYVFNAQAPDAGNMEILREFGTPAQHERWLAPLVRGEIRSCFAMTEPDHPGSNPVWMGTTAVRDGDALRVQRPQVVCLGGRRRATSRS